MNGLEYDKKLINKELETYFNKKIKETNNEILRNLLVNIKEYVLRGGKRIRPLLVINAYKCFKDQDAEVVKASIFIELIQTYLLIHDDIIDRDNLRRGGPTIHKLYSDLKKDSHFGDSMAINAGDLVCSFVYDSITRLNFKEGIRLRLIQEINKLLEEETYGQSLDVYQDSNLDEKAVINIYNLKTVPYTSKFPLKIGAILAESSEKDIKLLENVGKRIGLAFQIKDDILDVFGGIERGKELYGDIKEGKKTLLFIKALALCNSKDHKFLKEKYGNKNLSDEDILRIKDNFEKSGSLKYCKRLSLKLLAESKELLLKGRFKKEGVNNLIEIFEFIVDREF